MSDPDGRKDICWSPRVRKWKVRRLYELSAQGIYDDDLLDDVGMTLYMRCRDILTIKRARVDREVRCPRCEGLGRETFVPRSGGRDGQVECAECGWRISWIEYQRSFKRRQLNSGGAAPAFEAFIERFERARDPRAKMFAIDRVIHEFHYSLRGRPEQPTRAAGVNLIAGRLTDVVRFLDELSGLEATPEQRAADKEWRRKHDETYWPGIMARRDGTTP